MVKKVVATLRKAQEYSKVIKMVKSTKGSYTFSSEIVPNTDIQSYLASNKN